MQRGRRQSREIEYFLSSCEENEIIARKFSSDLMGVVTSVEVSRDKKLAQKQYLKHRVQIIPTL